MTKAEIRFATLGSNIKRSRELDKGLRCHYQTSGILLRVRRSGDITLLHDYLKSCIRHGEFFKAMFTIKCYTESKRKLA